MTSGRTGLLGSRITMPDTGVRLGDPCAFAVENPAIPFGTIAPLGRLRRKRW